MSEFEKTIGIAVLVLFFAYTWYLEAALKKVHHKLDLVLEAFDGLREYLYEIDPQFSDERDAHAELNKPNNLMSGIDDIELLKRKKETGRRTLTTSFIDKND
jgi:hypothetical protein